jgi:hypothetical protein
VPAAAPPSLRERLAAAGRAIGAREAPHREALEAARQVCDVLHRHVRAALDEFHAEAAAAGAPQLRLDVGEPRLDEKHVRAVEFELRRGRHVGIVVVKAKGEVTLVGPFRTGKAEGPCRSVAFGVLADVLAPTSADSDPDSASVASASAACTAAGAGASAELETALGDFLERFVDEATTP